MTEHKFTDEEIKKALECCFVNRSCKGCSQYAKDNCIVQAGVNALELINRYEEKVEELEIELKAMRGAANSYKAEIERLTVNMNAFGLGMKREAERADTARAEATKEFAEKLTHTLVINNEENTDYFDFADTLETIDAIKEEMTGETKTADTDFPKDYSYGY